MDITTRSGFKPPAQLPSEHAYTRITEFKYLTVSRSLAPR